MLRQLGYVAIALSLDATTNRTCRLRNATPERLRELIAMNLEGLGTVLQFNLEHDISLYRISSMVIPFGSHPVNQLRWWEEFEQELSELGRFIRDHQMRVSMHPGQFTVLGSPREEVVTSAIEEIEWHVRFLDALGVDDSCKVIIHIGGAYGNKRAAIQRFIEVANTLPERQRARLVIENDERTYTAEEVLAISAQTGLPVVFDWLHHRANPGDATDEADLIARCFATCRERDGIPKMHLSSQVPGGPVGKHADWVDPSDLRAFLTFAPEGPFDCMLEAKRKDQALFKLREDLSPAGVGSSAPPRHSGLRGEPSMRTQISG